MVDFTIPMQENELIQPFWDGCKEGKLKFPYCQSCNEWKWYPIYRCPHCERAYEWKEVIPKATLYSWTVLHKAYFEEFQEQLPLVVAVGEIEDAPGVRLICNMATDEMQLKLGMPLEVQFKEWHGMIKPIFSLGKTIV